LASVTELMHAFGASPTNVAEGYPRFALTPTQQGIVDRFPRLLAESMATPYAELEARAARSLLWALGQRTAPVGVGRLVAYYAAGVAIDVVGRCLAGRTDTVAVIHPTLDCLPALIRSRGVNVVPFAESRLDRSDPLAGLDGVGGLYIANPNNPTGRIVDEVRLRRLAEACAERGVALAIDACFRAFDLRVQYDSYAVLDETGVDYVVIEDTGKLWPLGGIRLSFLVFAEGSKLGIPEASADLLYQAPPFATLVVEAFAKDMSQGGMQVIHDRLAANRAILAAALDGTPNGELVDGRSKVSMSLIRLADRGSTRLWGRLLREGVHAVPGRPIWWARPTEGERYLRVALAREPDVISRAGTAIRTAIDTAAAT
jgi:histidinol-phosphate/aromatic aminotransferase/cobyric acid decarboxylase-like protein